MATIMTATTTDRPRTCISWLGSSVLVESGKPRTLGEGAAAGTLVNWVGNGPVSTPGPDASAGSKRTQPG
jgi:hypothetical protein